MDSYQTGYPDVGFPDYEPYLPILQEEMGRGWGYDNFQGINSLGGSGSLSGGPYDDYDYQSILDTKNTFANAPGKGVREKLVSNNPNYFQIDPFTSLGDASVTQGIPTYIIILLIICLLVIVFQEVRLYNTESFIQRLLAKIE